MITVGIFAYTNKLSIAGVLVAAFLAAFGSVFYSPAANTLLLDIIPRDDMVRGQSVFSASSSLVNTVGTAFSGVMVAFFGVPLIVIINGLSNLYSAFSELFIRVPKTLRQGETVTVKGVLRDMGSAIKAIFSEPCLKIFIPCAIILNFLSAGSYSLLLPFCMQKGFSVDMYGYLMSITTVASLICVVLLGIIKLKPTARFWVMAISFTSSVLFMVFAFLTENFVTMCILGFLGAFMNCAGNAVFNASNNDMPPTSNKTNCNKVKPA
jgi:MFS family permease